MQAKAPGYDAVIVGLGETGYACARHLVGRGLNVAVTDSRAEPPRARSLAETLPTVDGYFGGLNAGLMSQAGLLVLSPGVDPRMPAVAGARTAGVPITGEIELFASVATAPVVAITGSNGKSTVTTLVGRMIEAAGQRAAVGGNLGVPALDLLTDPEPDVYVLELSSFQLETVRSLDAAAAVVLNVSADHMDRYDGLEDYIAAKRRVYRGHGVMVVNADDDTVSSMTQASRPTIRFSLGATTDGRTCGLVNRDGDAWIVCDGHDVLPVAEVALTGRHNLANALAAVALGYAVDTPIGAMADALRRFGGLAHRTENLGERRGLLWLNDSKATNVGAAVAAIEGMDRPLVLIAGGQGKGQRFEPLVEALAGCARGIVLMGESAAQLASLLVGVAPVVQVASMADAVRAALDLAHPGDAVLLSPACASFDMFDGYARRGNAFRAAVEELTHE